MFLISDKLEKPDPKYDLMKDEKRDLMKEENLQLMATTAPKSFQKCHILYSIVIAVVFFSFAWMMMSPKYGTHELSKIEEQTLQVTTNVVNDAKLLLNQIRERSATMSEQNKRAAAEYVAGVRDALRERTNIGVQKANQIVLDKIRDVENELTSFGFVIDDAVNSFVEDAEFDIKGIRAKVAQAESGDAALVLDDAIRQVEEEIRLMLTDVDQMYSFYGRYIGNIVEHFMQNATDRISIMLNAQRRNCDCTMIDRINMCYNISAQNSEVSRSLEAVIKMVNIVQNTTDTVKGLERIYSDMDEQSQNRFQPSSNALEQTMADGRHAIDTILEDDSCFLGSMVRQLAYSDHATLKEFMIRSMKTVIESLSRSLHNALDDFDVVKPIEHRNQLVVAVEEKLETLVNEMKSKASLVPDADKRAEYLRRANLDELKELVKAKFANATHVVNGLFADNKNRLSDNLKYNLGYIVGQQLPYISTLTIQNYIPSDVCPLSVDYQKFVSTTLKETMKKDDGDIITELFQSANYFGDDVETGAALASSDDYVSIVPVDVDDGQTSGTGREYQVANTNGSEENSDGASSTLMNLIKSIISTINNSGYTVEGPVRIIVTDDDKK